MPAHKQPVPDWWNEETWAEQVGISVLRRLPKAHRGRLPLALAVQLARLCYKPEMKLRAEIEAGAIGANCGLLLHALSSDFGLPVEYMARVRRIWFKDRGAVDVAQHSGEPRVSGQIIVPNRETGRVSLKPRGIALYFASDEYHAWQRSALSTTGRYPATDDIAEMFERIGYERPSKDQIQDALKLVKKAQKHRVGNSDTLK